MRTISYLRDLLPHHEPGVKSNQTRLVGFIYYKIVCSTNKGQSTLTFAIVYTDITIKKDLKGRFGCHYENSCRNKYNGRN